MMSANAQQIKAIHAEARRIGMDEDMRRSFMLREVGKDSSKDMTEAEAQKVILALRKLDGSRTGNRKRSQTVSGKFAGILRAMWLNAYNLGVIRNRDDKALIAFAKRQTGYDHTQFLTDGTAAGKVIDALKAMMARDAGVNWCQTGEKLSSAESRTEFNKRRVLTAQLRILGCVESSHIPPEKLNAEIARLGVLVREKQKAAA
ncbi:Bacteriophage Mu [Bartonella choladocola]|uniref:regulatory protein GemA n=1 Tax=Bartonella choladocola TaxID=2750995 RepID=UPI0039982CBF